MVLLLLYQKHIIYQKLYYKNEDPPTVRMHLCSNCISRYVQSRHINNFNNKKIHK